VIQQTPRGVPGLPEVRGLAPSQLEQTVGSVQLVQEIGSLSGRLLFAVLVIRVADQKRLLRIFLLPGLFLFPFVYYFAAAHSLSLFKCGMFLAALLMNASASFWWNHLPRIYPTYFTCDRRKFCRQYRRPDNRHLRCHSHYSAREPNAAARRGR
jgi:hypothetical protein